MSEHQQLTESSTIYPRQIPLPFLPIYFNEAYSRTMGANDRKIEMGILVN